MISKSEATRGSHQNAFGLKSLQVGHKARRQKSLNHMLLVISVNLDAVHSKSSWKGCDSMKLPFRLHKSLRQGAAEIA